MPYASAIWRASAAGTCPASSSSGRLLMIVRTPCSASASISCWSSAPAAAMPGARAARLDEDEGMGRLRKRLRNRFAAHRRPVILKMPVAAIRHSRRSGKPEPQTEAAALDPRFRGGDDNLLRLDTERQGSGGESSRTLPHIAVV